MIDSAAGSLGGISLSARLNEPLDADAYTCLAAFLVPMLAFIAFGLVRHFAHEKD